nr:hypothetical protein [Tanacetum cinerariifolium]
IKPPKIRPPQPTGGRHRRHHAATAEKLFRRDFSGETKKIASLPIPHATRRHCLHSHHYRRHPAGSPLTPPPPLLLYSNNTITTTTPHRDHATPPPPLVSPAATATTSTRQPPPQPKKGVCSLKSTATSEGVRAAVQ